MGRHGHPAERRQFGRRATHMHGRARIPGRPDSHCLLRDISAGGARLEFQGDVWLPYMFELVVESHGLTVWCEVRHQRGSSVGVMFVTGNPGEQAVIPAFDVAQSGVPGEWQGTGQTAKTSAPDPGPAPRTGSALREKLLKTYGK